MSPTHPDGYLALPAAGTASPVLVLHPWWGLNDTVRGVCDRLADAGFVAFAPDLYHGEVTDQIAEADRLAAALGAKVDQARAEIDTALTFIRERAGQPEAELAVIGFSMGAFYALDLSARADQVRRVVVFYGAGPADFNQARAAYLGHFAADDPYESVENVAWLETTLKDAGRPVTFYTYPATGHWFFEPDRPDAYNAAAADLAWERTLAFLRESTTG